MNFDLKLGKAASVLFLALAMAGCGGGGGTTQGPVEPPPDPTPVDLSGVTAGYEVGPGTYDISAGESMAVGDVMFSCAAGGADCTVMVAADGTATYATEGGMVTAMNSAAVSGQAGYAGPVGHGQQDHHAARGGERGDHRRQECGHGRGARP